MTDPTETWSNAYHHAGGWRRDFPPLSLPDMFIASAERNPDAPLIEFLGRSYPYSEVADGARRVAAGLQRLGIARGDRIGLFLPNVPHYVAAYYGALMAGAVVVNFSPLYTAAEREQQVEDSGNKKHNTKTTKTQKPTTLEVLELSSLERLVVGSGAV